jgi:hypothetical protein
MLRMMTRSYVWVLLVTSGLTLLAGCDGTGHARYTPKGDEARTAIEAVLSAWREGRAYEKLEATPPIRVVDSGRKQGQELEAYEILNEAPSDGGTVKFTVRLSIKNAKSPTEAVYLVHGRDPIWVYSEDDYGRMLNMDNNPADTKSKSRQSRRSR